ncbi:phage shock protein PspC (stress-responsive transcriptional regulator) [Kineococcus xinjiangensis]|uniref:Phage shock protein PspC (Stress-responsive transcriptional regulator) n=1 Tax=Kineococcus xinjiangensis TaxID=512762 RepID=A0A2S6IG73_9ACTN|nr:PspC domain-containing protein [Kineococcus xinjiangensis]PPK93150.1 phage shock protein PspC (stress-responsive transcriptional regulator) [Kineococcus xinjiangensis]
MDTTPPRHEAPPQDPPRDPAAGKPPRTADGQERFFAAVRRLGVQRDGDRWFTGVCAGTAHRLGIDPVVVRALLVALTLAGGMGLALYGAAWALLPDADGRIEAERALAGDVSGGAVLAGGLVALDLFTGQGMFAWERWGASPGWSLLVTALAAAGVWWVVRDRLPTCANHRAGGPSAQAPRVSLRKEPPTAGNRQAGGHAAQAGDGASGSDRGRVEFEHARKEFQRGREQAARAADRAARARLETDRRRRERAARRRPGSPLLTAACLGLALLASGAVVLADRFGVLPGRVLPLALAAAVLVLGAGAFLAGVRGRRSGTVGVAVPLAVVAVLASSPGGWGPQPMNEQLWSPVTAPDEEDPQRSREMLAGRLVVDTSGAGRARDGGPAHLAATVGAGTLDVEPALGQTVLVVTDTRGDVEVPEGADVVELRAPQLTEVLDAGYVAGAQEVRAFLVGAEGADAPAGARTVPGVDPRVDVVVAAEVGAGRVRIETPRAAEQDERSGSRG